MVFDNLVDHIKQVLKVINQYKIAGNSGIDLVVSLIILITTVIVLYGIKFVLIRRVQKTIEDSERDYRQIYLHRIINIINNLLSWPVIFPTALYLATAVLEFNAIQRSIANGIIYAFIAIIIIKYLFNLYDILENYYQRKIGEESKQITEFLKLIAKVITTLLIILIYLSAIGIKITAFLAGFGVAGIVVGLALQEVISDLFASVSIYLDQPFEIGDRIEINGEKGIIKKIGIRSTKIRSLDGHLMIVANQNLTTHNIKNFKKMERRRAKKTIGIAYETPPDTLEQIPMMIEEVIESIDTVDFERASIVNLGDYAIDFEFVYYVNSRKKSIFVRKQHQIYLGVLKKFDKIGIEIPYPKQEVYRQEFSTN